MYTLRQTRWVRTADKVSFARQTINTAVIVWWVYAKESPEIGRWGDHLGETIGIFLVVGMPSSL